MRLQDGRRIEWQNECFLLLTDAKMHDTSFAAYVLWVAGVWPSIWSFAITYINWMKLHFADIQATVPRKSWRGLLFGVENKSIQWRTWESLEFESSKAGKSHREIENIICRIYIQEQMIKRNWRGYCREEPFLAHCHKAILANRHKIDVVPSNTFYQQTFHQRFPGLFLQIHNRMECIHQEGQRELDTVAVQAAAEEARWIRKSGWKWFWEIHRNSSLWSYRWSMIKYTWKM